MKFTTRLLLTFLIFIVLPMSLAIVFYILLDLDLRISKEVVTLLFFSLLGVLLLSSIPITFWLRHSFVRPLNDLKVEMRKIAEGNFSDPVESREKGEIGELFADFEKMRKELKNSADEKVENERKNRELIRNISHDLKTPVTSIKGYVEGIMDGVADSPEKMERYIRTISVKANDMDRLIDELTIYSRFDSNQVPLEIHILDVNAYFDDCSEEVGLDLESKGIKFKYSNTLPVGTKIMADPEQLKRVINNIINNSVKYRKEENSEIRIDIKEDGDNILVEISDNGRGVKEEDLSRLFDRFYRTDSSRNSREGGSGIGLAIANKIIEDHGGNIWASGEEGVGLCIHFTVKRYNEPVEVTEESEDGPIVRFEKMVVGAATKNRNRHLSREAGKNEQNTDN